SPQTRRVPRRMELHHLPKRSSPKSRVNLVTSPNVFVGAAVKEKSPPGTAVQIVAKSGLLLKSVITAQELFVTLARLWPARLIPPSFRDWLSELFSAA